jgi:hypothetical protein
VLLNQRKGSFNAIPLAAVSASAASSRTPPTQILYAHRTRQNPLGELLYRKIKSAPQIDTLNVGGCNATQVASDRFATRILDRLPCMLISRANGATISDQY